MGKKSVIINAAGTSFKQKELKDVTKETKVMLRHEPTNFYDNYAIQIVDIDHDQCIGYIPMRLSEQFYELITETGLTPPIIIAEISEYDRDDGTKMKGVAIEITYPDEVWG